MPSKSSSVSFSHCFWTRSFSSLQLPSMRSQLMARLPDDGSSTGRSGGGSGRAGGGDGAGEGRHVEADLRVGIAPFRADGAGIAGVAAHLRTGGIRTCQVGGADGDVVVLAGE